MKLDLTKTRQMIEQLTPGVPQGDLTSEIRSCPCPEEARAGLYLINGDWENAHVTSQGLSSPTAEYWHALVHRHEPDLSNSKYWLRRVGPHPIHDSLATRAQNEGPSELYPESAPWDALRFADLFAGAAHKEWSIRMDEYEMKALMDFSLQL